MAFPVTLNGRTYTLADFAGTNYVEGLPDAFEDFVTQAGSLYSTTSTTSNAIGTGSKTFTVEASKPYQVGTPLRIADTAAPSTNWIDGIVTAYSGTTLVVDAVAYAGSGTKTAWSINIGGGPIAYTGTLPVAQGGTGATTAADARTNLDTYSKAEADSRFLNVSGEASDVVITGSFTSPGIDDNASSTTMTLDASGNLLVGTTSTAISNEGAVIFPSGVMTITNDGGRPLRLNRKTDDGALLDFDKDNTTVGSIGAKAGDLVVGTGDTGLRFSDASSIIEPQNITTNTGTDGTIDLGWSSGRFKDLYLSGGVYLGGTGAANKLDDYEEGTWTPSMSAYDGTVTSYGEYFKVGNMVTAAFSITLNGSDASAWRIANLPFNWDNSSGGLWGGCITYQDAGLDGHSFHMASGNDVLLYNSSGATRSYTAVGSTSTINGFVTYKST